MKATHESFLHDLRAILRRPASPPPGRVLCFPPPQADYVPAFIRRYPFLTANLKGAATPGVLIDISWRSL